MIFITFKTRDKNRKYQVSTSSLGNERQQTDFAVIFIKKNISRENGNF